MMLYCYSEERAFWTKDVNEVGLDVIFSQEKENTITYKRDPDKRYTILSDSSLVIRNAAVSDSGIYYCKHSPVVNLTVFPLKGEKIFILLTFNSFECFNYKQLKEWEKTSEHPMVFTHKSKGKEILLWSVRNQVSFQWKHVLQIDEYSFWFVD